VLNTVERSVSRRRRGETIDKFNARAEVVLEYSAYLRTVLRFREQGLHGWILPAAKIWGEDGKLYAEVDVMAISVPKPHQGPVKVELLEVSRDNSQHNQEDNRRKLDKIVHLVQNRFNRNVAIEGYFNDQLVVSWPSRDQRTRNRRRLH
jgi:hypothetical protein